MASDILETILIKYRTPKHSGESYKRNISQLVPKITLVDNKWFSNDKTPGIRLLCNACISAYRSGIFFCNFGKGP